MNRLISALLTLFFRFHAARRGRGPGVRPRPDRIRRILLVSTTGLGDTVLSLPALAAARRVWPQAEISFLVHRRWAGLFAAVPGLHQVISYPGKYRRVRSLLASLRRLAPDLALILHHNDPDLVPLLYLADPGFLVCRAGTRFNFLLDLAVPNPDPQRHIAERRIDLVRSVAGPVQAEPLCLMVPEDQKAWAEKFWRDQGLKSGERLAVLNPGGSRQAKRWPEEHWRELIRRLRSQTDWRPALFGSPGEKQELDQLAGALGFPDLPVVTRPDLLEAAALLERAAVLIGPDSGLGHLAVALGLPVVILFGPDNPALSGPYRPAAPAAVLISERSVCPDLADCHKKECRPNACLWAVTPDRVLAEMKNRLGFPLDIRLEM